MIVLSRMEQWFHEFVLKYVKTPEKEGYSGVVLALDKKIKDEYESALDGYYLIDKEDAVYRETQINLVCMTDDKELFFREIQDVNIKDNLSRLFLDAHQNQEEHKRNKRRWF